LMRPDPGAQTGAMDENEQRRGRHGYIMPQPCGPTCGQIDGADTGNTRIRHGARLVMLALPATDHSHDPGIAVPP
jgi:hypothetical protein